MVTKEQLGKKIKTLRKSKKITQEKLAEAIDVDFGYISKLEVGQNFPSISTLNKIAKILNVNISEFFEYTNLSDLNLTDEIIKDIKNLPFEKQVFVYKFITSIK